MKSIAVVVGRHYWLIFDECRVLLIIKVYNIESDGLVGGLLYNGLTGEVSFSKGFHPKGPEWSEFNAIPEEDDLIEVRTENVYDEIKKNDLRDLKRIAIMRVDDFFGSDVSNPHPTSRRQSY